MIGSFVHQALPMRVVFGAGSRAAVREEVDRLALSRVLVLCSPGRSGLGEEIADGLGDRAVGVLAQARMHVPVELARRARQLAVDVGADGCVAVGGGSAIGLGKAVALETGLPVVAVPTTYSGSEMTPVWGLTEAGRKRTGRDERVLPRTVIYDPELTVGLPRTSPPPAVSTRSRTPRRRCTHRTPHRSSPPSRSTASARWPVRCLGWWPTVPTSTPGPTRYAGPGSAASRSPARRCRCTTSCVTPSAAPSTCRMRRPTRWCCPTYSATTGRPHPTPWPPCRARWKARLIRPGGSGNSPARSVRPGRCESSGWPRPTSTASPTRSLPRRSRTRAW